MCFLNLDKHRSHFSFNEQSNYKFQFYRTLQPIFCEPVEEVLTYEALRSALADIQTHAQHIILLK